MQDRFSRTELLLGSDALAILAQARVAVFGLGGVGSYVVEALARSGVGALDLIDHDTISLTNINRQITATSQTLNLPKVTVEKERVLSINPDCKVEAIPCFFLPETAHEIDFSAYDYIVDAVDTITGKLLIIEHAQAAHKPIISCMGTAFKMDPTAFRVADIYQTSICPLAKIIRKECRKRSIDALKVVYSTEPVNTLEHNGSNTDTTYSDEPISRHGIAGSVAFVPSVAGLIIAGEVVKDLIR